jgi:hypothetical protein
MLETPSPAAPQAYTIVSSTMEIHDPQKNISAAAEQAHIIDRSKSKLNPVSNGPYGDHGLGCLA